MRFDNEVCLSLGRQDLQKSKRGMIKFFLSWASDQIGSFSHPIWNLAGNVFMLAENEVTDIPKYIDC